MNKDNPYAKLEPPASKEEIIRLLSSFEYPLPVELIDLLMETNGDHDRFPSVDGILEANGRLWSLEDYMPLTSLLFFARNGCGDYYGYAIRGDGTINGDIYFWDHEYDSRVWVACGLDMFFEYLKVHDV